MTGSGAWLCCRKEGSREDLLACRWLAVGLRAQRGNVAWAPHPGWTVPPQDTPRASVHGVREPLEALCSGDRQADPNWAVLPRALRSSDLGLSCTITEKEAGRARSEVR